MIVQMIEDVVKALKKMKLREINLKRVFVGGFVILFACIVAYTYVYSSRVTDCENRKKIEIVTIDTKQYAVIAKYEEKWIIKECKSVKKGILINRDGYRIEDITSYPIKYIENGISNKDSLSSSNIYFVKE